MKFIQSIMSSIQFSCWVMSNSVTPWTAGRQASLSITNSRSLLRLMPIKLVMLSNHLILCRPLLLLPPIPPSIFSSDSVLHIRWPKDWSFSFNISPSNEYSGLISFRMDWLDLLAVQGTLKSLLQHHGSKASILLCSSFFIVQFSHPYMTTGKTIALTRWTFVGKVMSLLLNMLSSQFSTVTESCPTLCKLLDCSMPAFPVHHQLPELAQTHVHQVSDAIQPSHPLSLPFPPAFNPSQHQGLFQWASSSHQVAKLLKLQL